MHVRVCAHVILARQLCYSSFNFGPQDISHSARSMKACSPVATQRTIAARRWHRDCDVVESMTQRGRRQSVANHRWRTQRATFAIEPNNRPQLPQSWWPTASAPVGQPSVTSSGGPDQVLPHRGGQGWPQSDRSWRAIPNGPMLRETCNSQAVSESIKIWTMVNSGCEEVALVDPGEWIAINCCDPTWTGPPRSTCNAPPERPCVQMCFREAAHTSSIHSRQCHTMHETKQNRGLRQAQREII